MPTNTGFTGEIKEGPATPLKRSGQELDAREHTFHALAETATDAVVLADSEGNITYWNGTATRMFGYTPNRSGNALPFSDLESNRFRQAFQRLLLAGDAALGGPRASPECSKSTSSSAPPS